MRVNLVLSECQAYNNNTTTVNRGECHSKLNREQLGLA